MTDLTQSGTKGKLEEVRIRDKADLLAKLKNPMRPYAEKGLQKLEETSETISEKVK